MTLAPLKAWFMIFRILAVVVWAVLTVMMSAAIAYLDSGRINWVDFILTLAIASLVQGFPAHIVNEIFDWQSGADRFKKLGEKSGGSKVIKSGLADIPQLWIMFIITTVLSFLLMLLLCYRTRIESLIFFFTGYFVCIFYTMPPFRWAYRPFAGEWLGGFTGILLNMTGTYFVQADTVRWNIVAFAATTGLIYIGIMMLFHYLDFESDTHANPKKNTTIVYLGLKKSKTYVMILLSASMILSIILSALIHPVFYLLTLCAGVQLLLQISINPFSPDSIIRQGKWVTLAMIVYTIAFTGWINIQFLWMMIPISVSFYLHKKFGKIRFVTNR